MRLTSVGFDYSISGASFAQFNYTFMGAPPGGGKDEIIAFAQDSIASLENVLDRVYPDFEKTADGEISSFSVAQGYNYRSEDSYSGVSRLRYELRLDQEGRPLDASIVLWAHDNDQNRLLGLHDSVVIVSREISRDARVQLERIESLRLEPFVVERYLQLEAPRV